MERLDGDSQGQVLEISHSNVVPLSEVCSVGSADEAEVDVAKTIFTTGMRLVLSGRRSSIVAGSVRRSSFIAST